MQIQSINNTPNFQAKHLRTAESLVNAAGNARKYKIDIYSIDKSDSELINKLLMKIDIKDRTDRCAVKEKQNINESIRYILTKALNLGEKSSGGVYMAVKNGKQISGFLDYSNSGIPLLSNLVVWRANKKDISRTNLFAQFLEGVSKKSKSYTAVYSEPDTKGFKWLLQKGFTVPPQQEYSRRRLIMENDNVQSSIFASEKYLETIAGIKVSKFSKPEQVELKNLNL